MNRSASAASRSTALANYLGRELCDTRQQQICAQLFLVALVGFAARLKARPVRIVRCDFDGSRLGTVELSDGRSIDIAVDVDAGHVSLDALHERDASWVEAHQGELHAAYAARGDR